jgi:hypothetical protein
LVFCQPKDIDMDNLLQLLQEVDLGRRIQALGGVVHNADQWLLGIVVVALVFLGHKMASGHAVAYGWGLRLAALTFLGYGGYAAFQAEDLEQALTFAVLSRPAIAAGIVLGASWILLPILLFVYRNFLFGVAGFGGYAGYALFTVDSLDSEALPWLAARGGAVAGLAMVVAWILRPIWEFAAARWPAHSAPALATAPAAPPASPAPAPAATLVEQAAAVEAALRLSRRERKRTRMDQAQTPPPDIEGRRRRNKARLDAELTYLLASDRLGGHFPRQLFDRWMVQYLGDDLSPEEVEENSRHFQEVFGQQPQESVPSVTLDELQEWFADEHEQLEALDLDPMIREAKLQALQELYDSLSQRFPAKLAIVSLTHRRPVELLAAGNFE